ncbi:bacteriohemerythrin [Dongshaea marina]|uniref:bacteriohemerythrin n=1 Tax=Dongshaea marina TaxID=2047966 RepID=UPI000D3EDEE6|nr:bacteriohemerythrin [Dongshaea marina]
MEPIQWGSYMELGLPAIDKQHQALIQMINTLAQRLESEELESLPELIQSIVDYGQHHFQTEDAIFSDFDPDYFSWHQPQHHKYCRRINHLAQQFSIAQDKHACAQEILNFLYRWWVSHITEVDLPMKSKLAK